MQSVHSERLKCSWVWGVSYLVLFCFHQIIYWLWDLRARSRRLTRPGLYGRQWGVSSSRRYGRDHSYRPYSEGLSRLQRLHRSFGHIQSEWAFSTPLIEFVPRQFRCSPDIEKWSSSYRTSTSLTAWHRTKRWISVWSIWKWGSETRSENFWWTELLVLCLYCAYVSYCRGIFQQIEGDVGSASGVTDVFRSHFFQRWSWSSCLFTCMIMYSSVANLIKAFHVFFFHPSTERKLCQLMVLTPLIVPLVPPFEVETTCQWGFFFIFIFSKSLGDV